MKKRDIFIVVGVLIGALIVGFAIGNTSGFENGKKESFDTGYDSGYVEGYAAAGASDSEPVTTPVVEDKTPPAEEVQEAGVVILSHSKRIERNLFIVAGEIQNNTSAMVESPKVVVTFYDVNNQVVATDFSFAQIRKLAAGQKSPFEVNNYPNEESTNLIDHYELQVDYR